MRYICMGVLLLFLFATIGCTRSNPAWETAREHAVVPRVTSLQGRALVAHARQQFEAGNAYAASELALAYLDGVSTGESEHIADARAILAEVYAFTGSPQFAAVIIQSEISQDRAPSVRRRALDDELARYSTEFTEVMHLAAATELHSEDPFVWRALGHAYVEIGLFPYAANALRMAAERLPESMDIRLELADVLARAGQTEDAIARLTTIWREYGVWFAGVRAADICLGTSRLKDARVIVDRLLERQSEQAEVHELHGRILLAEEQSDAAYSAFARAIGMSSELVAAHLGAGRAAMARGRSLVALGHYQDALRKARGSISIRQSCAYAARIAGDTNTALKMYEEILTIDPWHRLARDQLAFMLIEKGELKRAGELVEPLRADFPEDPGILGLDGYLQLRRRRYQEAYQLLGESLRAETTGWRALQMAKACEAVSRNAEGVEWLAKAIPLLDDAALQREAEELRRRLND